MLACAPAGLRSRITSVSLGRYGLQARLRSGLVLRFGDGQRLRAKWIAARRVMSDPGAASATYIDLRDPVAPGGGRPDGDPGRSAAPLSAVTTDPAVAAATTDPAVAATDPAAATTDPAAATTAPATARRSRPPRRLRRPPRPGGGDDALTSPST